MTPLLRGEEGEELLLQPLAQPWPFSEVSVGGYGISELMNYCGKRIELT
jgi:hypothetical protein